jgi:hypothetical protein
VWSLDPRREALRKIHRPLRAAGVFGTRVAETISASGHVRPPPTGRTYDRKRSDQNTAKRPCKGGRPHMMLVPSTDMLPGYDGLLSPADSTICRNAAARDALTPRAMSRSGGDARSDRSPSWWGARRRSLPQRPRIRHARTAVSSPGLDPIRHGELIQRISQPRAIDLPSTQSRASANVGNSSAVGVEGEVPGPGWVGTITALNLPLAIGSIHASNLSFLVPLTNARHPTPVRS